MLPKQALLGGTVENPCGFAGSMATQPAHELKAAGASGLTMCLPNLSSCVRNLPVATWMPVENSRVLYLYQIKTLT